jgi:hypothetical protein
MSLIPNNKKRRRLVHTLLRVDSSRKRNSGGKQGTAGLFVIAFSVVGASWERGVSLSVAIEVALDVASVDVNVRGRESIVEVKACLLIRN